VLFTPPPLRLRALTLHPPRQNFAMNVAEAQLIGQRSTDDGSMSPTWRAMDAVDTFFTVLFTAELLINLSAHWLRPFFSDGWSLFDLFVIVLSLVALGPIDLPANALRSLRAFRVVRLFGRLGPLRDIVESLTAAVVPILNAFLVLLIVSSVCEHGGGYNKI
jgi:voltage-gated sodium channel